MIRRYKRLENHSPRTEKTEITAQRWEKFALVVLGSMLDEVPMVEELLSRAYDARD